MNNEERVKLVFETISKIAGFEIKPDKEFYMIGNGIKGVYKIDENLKLYYKKCEGGFASVINSDYGILQIFKGDCQLEEIKEPLLTDEGKVFLRQFKFDELLKLNTYLYMYDESNIIVTAINLTKINITFDGLKENKKYFRAELWL